VVNTRRPGGEGNIAFTTAALSVDVVIHEGAIVSNDACIGKGTTVWHGCQVRERASVGANCILGKNVYVDTDVVIGDRVKVQNNCSLYRPLILEDGVFIGPHVVFANDRTPRAINPDGTLRSQGDWNAEGSQVCNGASVGAGAIVLPGTTIGRWALVGAAAVVTRDVPERAIVVGNPARIVGYACDCGTRLEAADVAHVCPTCGREYQLGSGRSEG
jgi:acetyltransferase-like isoleucine patch superfamily enzyme